MTIFMNKIDSLIKILVKDLVLPCNIGVTERERQEKQPVVINIIMWADTEAAIKTDNIKQTVDYRDIYLKVKELIDNNEFCLLERLAGEIAAICLSQTFVKKVTVRVDKPHALKLASSAGVEITSIKDE
jgi:dihydroneopterin aldolase